MRLLLSLSALVALLLCAGCTGGATSTTPAAPGSDDMTAQIAAAPAPSGVDPLVWHELTAELVRVLEARSVAQASLLADNAGKHGGLPHQVSSPPAGVGSAAQLYYYSNNAMLSWGYACQGDYDQNGEVNIADLTPLAQHLGEVSAGGPGTPFAPSSLGSVIDGDGNGEINIGDVTPLGMNFGARVAGYRVYASDRADAHPGEPDAPNGPGTSWLAAVVLDTTTQATARRQLNLQVVPTTTLQYYWVRPYDGALDGAASNAVEVVQPPNQPPVATLYATGDMATLAHIVWDASGSHDLEGPIVKYEWDFDNDGVYEYDATAAAEQSGAGGGGPALDPARQDYYYYDAGTYSVGVRVTDGGGLTDTITANVGVLAGAGWHDIVAEVRPSWQQDYDGYTDGLLNSNLHLLDIESRPALIYGRLVDEPNIDDYDKLYRQAYLIAGDSTGTGWPMPQIIPDSGESCYVAVVEGLPAVVVGRTEDYMTPIYPDPIPEWNYEGWIYYLRARDASGTSWPTRKLLANWRSGRTDGSNTGPTWEGTRLDYIRTFQVTDGIPEIVAYRYTSLDISQGGGEDVCIRAYDALGATWPPEPQVVDLPTGYTSINNEATDWGPVTIGGLPAFLVEKNWEDILYVRALDATATTWVEPVLVDQLEKTHDLFWLLDIGGKPAAVYFDDGLSALKYRRALDAEGSTWAEPVVLSTSADSEFKAIIAGGRPTVIFKDRIDDKVKLVAANDELGMRWGLPSVVPGYPGGFPYVTMTPVASVNGLPAFAYIEYVSTGDYSRESRLHYAGYY